MKDLIIIGAGPAGLAASIYGIRAGLDLTLIEKFSPGGQVMMTSEVENYPGFADPVEGWQLMQNMESQVRRLGVEISNGEITSVAKDEKAQCLRISLADGSSLEARAVIAATGASLKKLGVPGESEFTGRGVSYCATCDGAFFKDRVTAVVGGGNVALEEALFLTRFSSKVYLIHRRDQFRGEKILQERIFASEKIVPVYDSVLESIQGDEKIDRVVIKNKKTEEISSLDVDGVFIFVGYTPNTQYLPAAVLNKTGEVVVDMNMRTPVPGLYAAGDLRGGSWRQIVTATADGATAAMDAYDYILDLT